MPAFGPGGGDPLSHNGLARSEATREQQSALRDVRYCSILQPDSVWTKRGSTIGTSF